MARLMDYSWPGNVRELENLIRRLVILTEVDATEALVRGRNGDGPTQRPMVTKSLREITRVAARAAERKALAEVLEHVHWNRAEASRILMVSYKTLIHKIGECGLTPPSRPRS
jgi:two-component system, NtrC family, response regulator AtoC